MPDLLVRLDDLPAPEPALAVGAVQIPNSDPGLYRGMLRDAQT